MKFASLLFALLVISTSAQAIQLSWEVFGDAYVDNDGDAANQTLPYSPLVPFEGGILRVNLYNHFFTFEEVMGYVSPYLESQFETFIIGNTATEGSSSEVIPFQHARVLHKKDKALPLFTRDASGKINGVNFDNSQAIEGIPDLVPISSGKRGDGGILTYSGVFRVSVSTSKARLRTSPGASMSYAVYLDGHYEGGRRASVAIHGTPKSNHKKLGVQRASHGCFRTFPAIAEKIYGHVMSEAMWAEDLPKFNSFENFPSDDVMDGNYGTDDGTKTLFIIFEGYSNPIVGV